MDLHSKKITEIKNELKVFQDKADALHKELTANAQKSQELHSKMLAKFEEMKTIRDEATNLHVMFLQDRARIKPLHDEIGKCIDQRHKTFRERQGQYDERKKQYEERRKDEDKRRSSNLNVRKMRSRRKPKNRK